MAAGGPGDHPLSDILNYDIEVYGKEADELLKKIAPLMTRQELWEWWEKEIGWECASEIVLHKFKQQLRAVETRAKNSGWEV